LICKIYNEPFINTITYNDIEKLDKKTKKILNILYFMIINYSLTYYFFSNYYLHNNDNTELKNINITKYVMILEFFYYCYHRLSHISYFYKIVHSDHHNNYIVYPIDFLDTSLIDNLGTTLIMNLPLYFVSLNYHEYAFLYYIYTTGGFLTHSDIIISHHKTHHKCFKYNYSLLFPIYDIFFHTYV
jgi:sterol desaturase/sphingolipid hydroxylase (fatty acid hydroxylase superfamily)